MINLKYSVILFFTIFTLAANAQNINDLLVQKSKIEDELKKSSKMLELYGKQKNKAITNIKLINNQITSRESLIDLYNTEIQWLNEDIGNLKTDISSTERDLQKLKDEYALLIQKSYENRKVYNEVTFFLGAESFNKAYRRFIILREYNKFRKNQGILIQKKQEELVQKQSLLETKLKVQSNALLKVVKEKDQLLKNKQNLNGSIQNLKRKERQVKRQIKDNQKALESLEKTILKLIEEANKETYSVTDFNKAIGRLKWPVKTGIIISKFGEHQHPVLKYVKVNNNGVDIQSQNNTECYAVFEGKVSRVVTIPGYNKTVIIRHGKYLTVYANLEVVKVKKGDSIKQGDLMGNIYNGEGENSNVLHFEIWEEGKKLNPEKWLLN